MKAAVVGGTGFKGARTLASQPVVVAAKGVGGGAGGGAGVVGGTPLAPIRAPDAGIGTAPSDSLSSNLDLQSKFEQAMHQVTYLCFC